MTSAIVWCSLKVSLKFLINSNNFYFLKPFELEHKITKHTFSNCSAAKLFNFRFGIFSGRPNSFSRGRHHNRGPRGEFIPSRNPNEPRRLSHPTVLETDSNSAPLMIHELPLTLFNSDTHATRGRTATENQSRNTTIEQNPAINSTRDNHSPTSRYSPFLYKRFSAKYAQKDKSVTLNYPSSRNNSPANQVNVDGPQSPELFSPATD